MKPASFKATLLLALIVTVSKSATTDWIMEDHKTYKLFYTNVDLQNKSEYVTLMDNGMKSVQTFFSDSYKKGFGVYVHPNRQSLDQQWQKDWGMPDFKSECWMVASGVATKLDVISPKNWDEESCEHTYNDKLKTQQLIAHELFHVYHGQLNVSPDFIDVYGIDWFVEGLATYASGQCDDIRIAGIKKLITENKEPKSLDDFWKGNLKYGLSGSVVLYLDKTYGRKKLQELLKFNKKTEILLALKITEKELLGGWKTYLLNYPVK